jgi:ABC-type lipoprotein release transport system permease subunit
MIAHLWRMGWRNLSRNRRRTWITVAALAGGVALSTVGMVMMDGFMHEAVDRMSRGGVGHVRIDHSGQLENPNLFDVVPDAEALIAELEADPRVRVVAPRIESAGLLSTGPRSAGAELVGVDAQREAAAFGTPDMLQAGLWPSEPGQVALGFALAETLHVELGDEVFFLSQAADGSQANAQWVVSGLVNSGDALQDRGMAWVPIAAAKATLALKGPHRLTVLLHDNQLAVEFTKELAARPNWSGVWGDQTLETWPVENGEPIKDAHKRRIDPDAELSVRSWKTVNPMIAQYQQLSRFWMLISVGIILATASIGAMNTMLMSVFERTREIGVLMAVGMKPRLVMGMVVLETLALALLALLVGMGLGALLSWYVCSVGVDFSHGKEPITFADVSLEMVFHGRWSVKAFVGPATILFFVTILSALWPAWRASRLKPFEALTRR